jgi:hypothetical protein
MDIFWIGNAFIAVFNYSVEFWYFHAGKDPYSLIVLLNWKGYYDVFIGSHW